jgi:hypothetical protein
MYRHNIQKGRDMNTCNSCGLHLKEQYFNNKKQKNRCDICRHWKIPAPRRLNDETRLLELHQFLKQTSSKAKQIISSYKRVDIEKGREFKLSVSFVENELIKGCFYCGHPSTGLDRIDNKIGHIESNCVSCCSECNIIRMDKLTHEDMKIIGKSIKQVKDMKLSEGDRKRLEAIQRQFAMVEATREYRLAA